MNLHSFISGFTGPVVLFHCMGQASICPVTIFNQKLTMEQQSIQPVVESTLLPQTRRFVVPSARAFGMNLHSFFFVFTGTNLQGPPTFTTPPCSLFWLLPCKTGFLACIRVTGTQHHTEQGLETFRSSPYSHHPRVASLSLTMPHRISLAQDQQPS